MTTVAVIYYSSTGNAHALAVAIAEGAADAGAEVRLRRVAELAPEEAIDANAARRAHAEATVDVPVASRDELRWADGFAFGSPTRLRHRHASGGGPPGDQALDAGGWLGWAACRRTRACSG